MALYSFKSDDDTVIERSFSMNSPQASGTPIVVDGVTYHRLLSNPQLRREFSPYATNALPKNFAGCQHDHKGRPVIESRKQEKQIAKEHGYVWL